MNMDNIGILDAKGRNKNPLTNESYSKQYKIYALKSGGWVDLPIAKHRKEIIQKINNNRVNIITSGTGAGKTVIIPKCALHTLKYEGKVVMTVPKRILAEQTAEWSAKTLDVRLGKEVGFHHGDSKLEKGRIIEHKGKNITLEEDEETHSKTDTKLLYATDGSIVISFLKDRDMTKKDAFNILIIDEAHERSIPTDQLLYLSREALRNNENFKVIITSATIDTELFANYFSEFNPIISEYPGTKQFSYEKQFSNKEIKELDYVNRGVAIIEKILNKKKTIDKKHQNYNQGAILFFVATLADGKKICEMIATKNFKKGNYLPYCIELASKVPQEHKDYAVHIDKYKTAENGPYNRKIVTSTNIAESSLTIKGLVYVIDSGYEWSVSYDPLRNMTAMGRKRISKAQAKQRWGRVGRETEGHVYCLYTEDEYNKFEDFPEPKIRRDNVDSIILNLVGMLEKDDKSVNNIIKILNEFIEPPNAEYVQSSIDILKTIDCTDENNLFTPLTNILKNIELKPQNARIIIEGMILDKKEISIIFACILEKINNLTKIGKLKDLEAYIDNTSDLITIKNIYDAFNSELPENRENFCEKNNLSYDELKTLDETIQKIKISLEKKKNFISKHAIMKAMPSLVENIPKYDERIHYIYHILLAGYSANLSKKIDEKNYRNCIPSIIEKFTLTNTGIKLDKNNKYIIYGSLLNINEKTIISLITMIPKEIINNLKKIQKQKLKICLKGEDILKEEDLEDEYYNSVIKKLHIDDDFNDDHIFELNVKNMSNFKTSLKDDITDLYPLYISPDLANLPRLDQLLKQFDKEIIDVGFLTDDLEHGTDIIAKKSSDTINLLKILTYNYSKLKTKYDNKIMEIEIKEKSISDFRNHLNKLKNDIRLIIDTLSKHNNQLNNMKIKIKNYEKMFNTNSDNYTYYLNKVSSMKNEILPQYEISVTNLEKSFQMKKNLYQTKLKELYIDKKKISIIEISLEILKNKLNQIILIKGGGLLTTNIITHFGGDKLKNPLQIKLNLILNSKKKKYLLFTDADKLFKNFNNDEIIVILKQIKVTEKYISYTNRQKLLSMLKLLILTKFGLINKKIHLLNIANILDIDLKNIANITDLKQVLQNRINF